MKSIKVAVILFAFLFVVGSAYAQEQRSADAVIQKMTTDLSLTSDQVAAIKPIIEANLAKRQELRSSTTDRSAIKSQMDELRQEEDQQLSQVLNPDQMSKLESMKAQRHQGGHHERSGSGD